MKTSSPSYTDIKINNLPNSEVEITGSITAEAFEAFRPEAVTIISKDINIPGFRKGNVPEKILISKIGIMPILEEMAEIALGRAYPSIVIDHKIDVIGRPEIRITKLAENNPLEFTIKTAVVPVITLPDYVALAKATTSKKLEVAEVTDEDVENVIKEIRYSRAHDAVHENGHDADHTQMSKEEHDKAVDAALPELNNEFVQSLGSFVDVDDFKKKVRENIAADKAQKAKDKRRVELTDAILDATTIEIPRVLIESELRRTEAQFKDDIERMGVNVDEYLKHIKKTIEDLRKEWEPLATRKAKLQLVLNKISVAEKLQPSPEKIEENVNAIMATYKDADRERATIFAETFLTNEQVFEFLEAQK